MVVKECVVINVSACYTGLSETKDDWSAWAISTSRALLVFGGCRGAEDARVRSAWEEKVTAF